jgi:hypothetical protein
MGERPKTPFELANAMLLESKPSELLKERGKESPSLDDCIIEEIDVTRAGHNDGK